MRIETAIETFGYLALIVGLILEGENVLVLAAFTARRGYLSLPAVILIGFVVTYACDQFFFWLGRTQGAEMLQRKPSWQPGVQRARAILERGSDPLFFGFRFMYGLRTVLPFVFGMERLSPKRFALLNFLATLLFGIAGYALGRAMEGILVDMRRYELWIAAGVVLAGAGVWTIRLWQSKSSS
jgi:membrane protein DedA with SNARE-associated domain